MNSAQTVVNNLCLAPHAGVLAQEVFEYEANEGDRNSIHILTQHPCLGVPLAAALERPSVIVPIQSSLIDRGLCITAIQLSKQELQVIVAYCCKDGQLQRCSLRYWPANRRVEQHGTACIANVSESLPEQVAINTTGSLLLTCSRTKSSASYKIVIWGETLHALRTLPPPPGSPVGNLITAEFCGEDQQHIIACFASGACMVWDILSGDLVCNWDTSLVGVSGVVQPPSLLYTHAMWQSTDHKNTAKGRAGTFVVVGYRDGRLRQYELLSVHARDINAVQRLHHRECGTVDITKELRFTKLGANKLSSAADTASALVQSSMVLCLTHIPAHRAASVGGYIAAVVAAGVCFVCLQTWKVVHALSADELGVTCPTSAVCALLEDADVLRVVWSSALSGAVQVTDIPLHYVFKTGADTRKAGGLAVDANMPHIGGLSYEDLDSDLGKLGAGVERMHMAERVGAGHVVNTSGDNDLLLSFFRSPTLPVDDGTDSPRKSLLYSGDHRRTPAAPTVTAAAGAAAVSSKRTTSILSGAWESPKKDKQGRLLDQPITFQRKIKSSGYGQIPQDSYERKKYFQQQEKLKRQNAEKAAAARALQRSLSAPGGGRDGTEAVDKGAHIRYYPTDCDPLVHHQQSSDIRPCPTLSADASCPIYSIAYSPDGSLLGIASADHAVLAVRLSSTAHRGEVIAYAGHDARLNGVRFSHSRYGPRACGGSAGRTTAPSGKGSRLLPSQTQPHYQLLSCSADGTARMWRWGETDGSALTFSHFKHAVSAAAAVGSAGQGAIDRLKTQVISGLMSTSSKTSAAAKGAPSKTNARSASTSASTAAAAGSGESRNRPYGDAVTSASYFYQDKFCVLTTKALVLLYQYNLHTDDADDDLKRTLAQGTYKLVHHWDLSQYAQTITATACINSALSPLIFAATSDKHLHVLDAATGSIARRVESPHSRAVHCVALPRPSIHVPISPDAYNCFLTAATDNAVRLWDLRTPTAVSLYSEHVNRREPVGCDVSPCLRYIATGSEDKTAVLYDLRTGRVLGRMGGAKDVVRCVAFHPLLPQLAAGSYDGTVRFYGT